MLQKDWRANGECAMDSGQSDLQETKTGQWNSHSNFNNSMVFGNGPFDLLFHLCDVHFGLEFVGGQVLQLVSGGFPYGTPASFLRHWRFSI